MYIELGNVSKTAYGSQNIFDTTHFSSLVENKKVILGQYGNNFNKKKVAFSPNNDGRADDISYNFVAIRNYKDLVYTITNKDCDVVFTSKNSLKNGKNLYSDSKTNSKVNTSKNFTWNGKKDRI